MYLINNYSNNDLSFFFLEGKKATDRLLADMARNASYYPRQLMINYTSVCNQYWKTFSYNIL